MTRELLTNKIRTPDGTILHSRNRHDYRAHKDNNTEIYMADGGLAYIRRNVNKIPYEELSIYTDSPYEVIREEFEWGTYGASGDQPLTYVKLKDLSTKHIKAILKTQSSLNPHVTDVFNKELKYRVD